MKRNVLNNYLNEQLRLIEKELNAFTQEKEPECLHKLRVCIKRIKAVLTFEEALFGKPFEKNTLNPLFHEAGKLRELHVILVLIRKNLHIQEKLTNNLTKKSLSLEHQFLKNIPNHTKEIKAFRKELNLPASLPSKKLIIAYFEKREKKADKKLQNKNRTSLHLYRRDIKRMMYVYEALPKKLQKEIGLNRTGISKEQEKIGNWHDTWSAVVFLSSQSFSKQINHQLSKLKEKEKKQFKALLL